MASFIRTDSIANREALWRQLRRRKCEFVFGLSSLLAGSGFANNEGLTMSHGFSIEGAYEFLRFDGLRVRKTRLLKIRYVCVLTGICFLRQQLTFFQ